MKQKIDIKSPDEVFSKFLNWFDLNKKIAFFSAIIVGIITHITLITEMIMSQDGLWNSIKYSRAGDWEMTLGRWGIEIIERINSFIAIPTITTVFCIIAMAVVSILLVDIFNTKSKISSASIGIIMVVSPMITATMLYIYTAFAYCFNMLLAVMAIWFIYKFKYKKIGLFLSVCSIILLFSIYQSYIGVIVGICMMLTILSILNGDKYKDIIMNILKVAICIIIGGILYYIITEVLLKISGLELASYKNIDSTSIMSIVSSLGISIKQAYIDFINFFFGNEMVYNSNYKREFYYLILFVLLTIISILNIVKMKCVSVKDKIVRSILIIIIMLLLPLGLNIIDVLIPSTSIYLLTAMQLILMIPFILILMEKLEKQNLLKWITIVIVSVISLTYYIADNTSYAAIKLTYNQAYSTTMRIIDRMENTPGYNMNDTYVIFGGIVGNNNFPRTSNLYGYTLGTLVNNVVFHGTYGGQLGTWENFLKIYYGLDIKFASDSVYYEIVTSEAYKNMEVFPSQTSVQIINDVMVVKLSETPPLPY